MKRILSIVLAALMCLALFTGCAAQKDVPAAKIGDMTVTVAQLENMYLNNQPYAAYYGYTLTDDASVEEFQDYLMKMLVETRVKQYKAEEAGIELTAEELEEAKTTADASYESTYQSFIDAAKEAGASDVNAYANELLTDALVRNNTTVRKMKKDFLDEARADLKIARHKEQLLEGVAPTEEELKALYDEELATQQASFDADTSAYFTQESYFTYGYGAAPLYVPAGLARVRHILVEDEATAQEVMDKLNAGEDFETLLAEYNTDPGMESSPDGYLVGTGASFVESFLEAALALEKDGDLSDIVQSDYGYHIIKRVSTEDGGVVPYEDVKESYEAFAKTQFAETYYTDLVAEWMAEEGLVTYYEENYRSVGKAA